MKHLIVLRHGDYGDRDLTEHGKGQAAHMAQKVLDMLQASGVTVPSRIKIYTSPEPRTRQTAHIFYWSLFGQQTLSPDDGIIICGELLGGSGLLPDHLVKQMQEVSIFITHQPVVENLSGKITKGYCSPGYAGGFYKTAKKWEDMWDKEKGEVKKHLECDYKPPQRSEQEISVPVDEALDDGILEGSGNVMPDMDLDLAIYFDEVDEAIHNSYCEDGNSGPDYEDGDVEVIEVFVEGGPRHQGEDTISQRQIESYMQAYAERIEAHIGDLVAGIQDNMDSLGENLRAVFAEMAGTFSAQIERLSQKLEKSTQEGGAGAGAISDGARVIDVPAGVTEVTFKFGNP